MNPALFAMLGWPEIMMIGVVVLVFFGAKKVPELMRGLGHGLKEFKKATRDVQNDLQRAMDEDPPAPPRRQLEAETVAHSEETLPPDAPSAPPDHQSPPKHD